MKTRFLAFALLTLVAPPLPILAEDGNAILAELDRRMAPETYEMYRKLINIEPDGSRKEFTLYTVKKGRDQMAALFLSPASEKGRATLRLGDNLWLYIPNVGKPLRITSLQSVVGGVFNNSDLLRLEFSTEYDVDSLAEDDGKHLLNLKAKSRNVAYDHLKMWVEKDSLLPVTIECYAASGLLIKTLHYSKVEDFGNGLRRPSQLITDSPLQKGYKSVMLFAKMKARPLDDEVFTLNYLPRLDELR
ncbi:MAG: outer membrane lipoprotein-sorting protein [Chromatiales bacterium]|nr:outer membrane lipoprotein-sorting protein [Chromatiales bacterium]